MNGNIVQRDEPDEQQLAGIIRRAGPRGQPGMAARDAVRDAVHAEWRAVVAARRRRQRTRWSLAAAAAAAAMAVWIGIPRVQAPAAAIAAVTRVAGPVTIDNGSWLRRAAPAVVGAALAAGTELRSAPGGRLALQIGATSVRLDGDSAVTMLAADRIALERGAVYVDSGAGRTGEAALVIETPLGAVEHLGTQYEARLAQDTLRVMVREGGVRIERDGAAIETQAGEQLTLDRAGDVHRRPIGRDDAAWAWAAQVAPAFNIENRPLPEFLGWVSRETGRSIAFASAAAEQAAGAVVLRGSVAGLTPAEALAAVLATTELDYRDTQPGPILIDIRQISQRGER